MPVTLSWSAWLIVLPLVFLAALMDAVGGGGGLIALPAYTLAGLPYGYASGCNKFSASFGSIVASIRYFRSGKVHFKPFLFAAIGSLPGSWIGTQISLIASQKFMQVFMLIATPCVGLFIFLKRDEPNEAHRTVRHEELVCLLIGFFTGIYDGFFGPGVGTFIILLFRYLIGMDLVSAAATARPVNLASKLTSMVTRIAAGQVIFTLAVPAMFMSIAGGWLGSKLTLTRGAVFVRKMMLVVLALMLAKLVWDLF